MDAVMEVAVPAQLPAVGALRRAVDKFLNDWSDPSRRNQILLAVSELGTNAIEALHDPGSEVTLRIRNLEDCIVIEIQDEGPGFGDVVDCGSVPPSAERGRGLQVVRAVADEFSVDQQEGRTTVRCAFAKN